MDKSTLNRLLAIGFEKGVSDIHFEVGYPPLFRARGQLIRSKLDNLSDQDTQNITQIILESNRRKFSENFNELDTSYSVEDVGRFRVSIFRQRSHFGIVMRVIPIEVLNFESLNLPAILGEIADSSRGLILVTGPTGNGKSTTLASMIRHINDKRYANIITIEDPIEFLFTPDKSCIIQREVGVDTESFATALRGAMRMDPDIIMVGELRDLNTIDACIKAAETGHLVLSTLHTNNATSTITRILSYFPAEAQDVLRQRLADILLATISLRLLTTIDGERRVPAVEIMRTSPTIQACIRETRLGDLVKHIEKGREENKMQTFDQHLLHLCQNNIVSLDEALQASSSTELERNLMVSS